MNYPSDLSDGQWAKIAKCFERPDARGAREKHAKRRVVEACFYRLREGCRWRALPHDFPPWSTVASHFRLWRQRGVWQEAVLVLWARAGVRRGWTAAGVRRVTPSSTAKG